MTHLELFQATVAREPHGEFLFQAAFTPALDRRIRDEFDLTDDVSLQDHFGMFDPAWVDLRAPADHEPRDYSRYYEDIQRPAGTTIDRLGAMQVPGSEHHFTRIISPLRNATRFDELESFPYPDNASYSSDHMTSLANRAREDGKVSAAPVGHMFEDAWQIRGMEPFLMDMAVQPEWCEYILDRITQRNLHTACAGAKAGVDLLLTADDVATQQSMMFSEEHWRRFLKPRWASIYSAARDIKPDIQICYHSDGNIESIIPELIEIGITILNPIQPECLDPVRVKREYGDKLVLDGTIGTQTTMPFGTPEDVRSVVRKNRETLGYDGGLILAPTHVLEPEVPVENVIAFVEAARTENKGDRR